MGKKKFYPEEVKREVIRLKLEGELTNKEIMRKFGIKNKSQIKSWMRCFYNGVEHRLAQPLGKQYSYGKGPENESDLSQLKKKVEYYDMKE
ncbi:helix-turn-helix domain-containing protein [Pontibacillus yanchengensis]|uniref:Helix-turn-helix domain-containing protein n=2 Tax=Pontibacillus yanchengensis TaxID=462910 RepID=A0ACC7VM42_9BACI|nr:helix-turn-helix domain-containing protein [Pontibacillus yanchengensis]MYL55815.1 helix-turn-helix domain-containing protein [Pontibacillus yanchengensis]